MGLQTEIYTQSQSHPIQQIKVHDLQLNLNFRQFCNIWDILIQKKKKYSLFSGIQRNWVYYLLSGNPTQYRSNFLEGILVIHVKARSHHFGKTHLRLNIHKVVVDQPLNLESGLLGPNLYSVIYLNSELGKTLFESCFRTIHFSLYSSRLWFKIAKFRGRVGNQGTSMKILDVQEIIGRGKRCFKKSNCWVLSIEIIGLFHILDQNWPF